MELKKNAEEELKKIDKLIDTKEMLKLLFGDMPPENLFNYFGLHIVKYPDTLMLIEKFMMGNGKMGNVRNVTRAFMDKEFMSSKKSEVENRKINLEKQKGTLSSFISTMWHSSLPCFDVKDITSTENGENSILKKCFWKDKSISCSAIFKKVATDQGMCCAFNKAEADHIFVKSMYTDAIKELETTDRKLSFENSSVPDWYREKGEPVSQAGTRMGLTLILDAHTDKLTELTVKSDYQGFTAMVAPKNDFPLTFQKGFLIRPGHWNTAALSAIKIDAEESIRKIVPEKRNCYFPDENKIMKLHKHYSQANCILECSLIYAQAQMKNSSSRSNVCTPWFFPLEEVDGYESCTPWEIKSILDGMERGIPPEACERCLPDCKQVIYQQSMTTSPFRKCNEKNFGMTMSCDLDSTVESWKPQIWATQVRRCTQGS